jgi:peptidoglycan LD-endopeptidase CwlK
MASRKLEDLHPDLLPLARMFLDKCKTNDLSVIVTCTYRSNAEQDELYQQGRKKPGPIVTRAWGGKSEHNFMIDGKPASKAFDIEVLANGKLVWNEDAPGWKMVEKIWYSGIKNDKFFLDWYGRPNAQFRELPHFCLKEIK